MAKHKIVIDTKHTVWRRTIMEVEAEDLNTAAKKGESFIFEDNDSDGEVRQLTSEIILDTEEGLSPQENYCMANAGLLAPNFKDDDNFYKCCEFQKDDSYEIKLPEE